ncbi:MAG TPA: Nif11-like leader peptide family natural product precursor [Chloroflexia bacterium]|nr:Nif11-like leader peptide family natural product precursor [Chloroflexia bacterium]
MSKQSAIEFLQAINTDGALREDLIAQAGDITKAGTDNKEFATEMAAFGSQHGYSFDSAEVRDAYREILENQLASSGRELADQELEVVAGGVADSGCCLTSASA